MRGQPTIGGVFKRRLHTRAGIGLIPLLSGQRRKRKGSFERSVDAVDRLRVGLNFGVLGRLENHVVDLGKHLLLTHRRHC